MDLLHSIMIIIGLWQNLVEHFGNFKKMDYITWYVFDTSTTQSSNLNVLSH